MALAIAEPEASTAVGTIQAAAPAASVDYDALAKQAGAVSSKPRGTSAAAGHQAGSGLDYDALAKQAGATSSRPVSAASPAAPEPSWRDRVITYLTRPKDAADTSPGMPGGDTYMARRALGGAASIILHPWDTATSAVQQAADVATLNPVALAIGTIAPESKVGQASHAAAARLGSQVKDMASQVVHDPEGFLGEQIGQGAVMHGAGEVLGRTKAAISGGVESAATGSAKALTGTSPADVGDMTRKVGEHNQTAIDKTAERNQAAVDRAAELNQLRLQNHAKAVDKVRASNDQARADWEAKQQANQQAAATDLADATQAATDATEAETTRGQLARRELELRNRVAERVRKVKATNKSVIDTQFDDVRQKVGDATVPLAPLVEAVGEAQDKFLGSSGSHRVFEDILKRTQSEAGAANLRDEVARGQGGMDYASMSPAHQKIIDNIVQDMNGKYDAARAAEPDAEKAIDFNHLRGYSSELGKALRDPNMAGDVRDALRHVKDQVDGMAQHLADSNGAGSKLKASKQNWRAYKQTFYEATGPSGSGSPVAKSLNAADAFNATQPFLDDVPAVAARAKRLLVGSQFEGAHYDPGAGKLIDQLRAVKRAQEALPKQAATAKAIAAGQAAETEAAAAGTGTGMPTAGSPALAGPKLAAEPEPPAPRQAKLVEPKLTDLTPERIQELKEANVLNSFTSWRRISPYRVAGMVAGGVGLVTGMANMLLDAGPSLAHSIEAGAMLSFATALGPRMLAKMLDSPKIIEKLTRPSAADFKEVMALPADQRTGVEAALKSLATEAQAKGKIKSSPWLAVVGATQDARARQQGTEAEQQQRAKQAAQVQELTGMVQQATPATAAASPVATPQTHEFNITRWQQHHPDGDASEAIQHALDQGYKVVR